MISKICGQLVDQREGAVIINVNGICYEVLVPVPVQERLGQTADAQGQIQLVIYHYIQLTPSSGVPVMLGFCNEIEREFFLQFITVSGIGPRAAVRALNKPLSQISRAIDEGDQKFLKTLPGIGPQKAKEIIAKLQGKVGKFGLIQDQSGVKTLTRFEADAGGPAPQWQEEALEVLLRLQYRKPEAAEMILKAVERKPDLATAEDLLNEIYKQRIKR